MVTEAPQHNLYQWASREYLKDGIVEQMISHGFHDEHVWTGILFQIVSALYVLQIHGIYIRDMTIEDNVFIKDLKTSGENPGYWKYIVNGISYYIPNYGYLVMIDSNFRDILPDTKILRKNKREYKLYTCDIIGKKYSKTSIRKKIFNNYRKLINTNIFTQEHIQNNVSKPPDSVMQLIERMMNDPEKDLGKVISRHFRMFMNNRIGTLLRKDSEIPNIRDVTGQIKDGEMVVQVVEENLYKWGMSVNSNEDGTVNILTKNTPESTEIEEISVRIETLKQYSTSEIIEQKFTGSNPLFTENELLETYMIN